MNKKFIAIITALALVVTLLAPVGVQEASAKSDNSVDRVVTVKDDTYIGGPDYPNAPNLIIEKDDNATWNDEQIFRLTLPSDAEWRVGTNPVPGVTVSYISDQTIEVRTDRGFFEIGNNTLEFPLIVQLDGAEGEVRVTLDARDSRLSSGSYTFAVVSSGDTVATVGKKEKVSRGSERVGATIVIDEVTPGAVTGTNKFRLRLPNNYSWHQSMEDTDGENGGKDAPIKLPAGWFYTGDKIKIGGNDNRDLIVEFEVTAAANTDVRQSITIEPRFNVNRDARYGDVSVTLTRISGDITSQSGLVIAEYLDYGVVVEVEEVKQILAGREDGSDDDYKVTVIIEEASEGSLVNGRVIDFELPSWVRIATDSEIVVDVKKGNGPGATLDTSDSERIYSNHTKFEIDVDLIKDRDYNGRAEAEIEIPLTINGTASGDIELVVSGAGIEEQTVVIAEAVAPVTAEVNVSDVRLGVQGQAAPEIIIKENVAGALKENRNLLLQFVSATGFTFDAGAKYEVIEGDLEIDLDESGRDNSNKALKIHIDAESTEPSTIRVSNIKMTVDRTAPEGIVQLDITGPAVVENGSYSNFNNRVARFDFANVITPAPGETRSTSVFTIDSTTYTVIEAGQEVERTMDVAPYIKDSRTFLPVFFVAQSLGVPEHNIVWEPHSKTVTIYKGDRIAQMQIGSNVLTVNGTSITMDTAPEIKDGRTMLPIYYVGQALGASVEWDGDARTVTVTQ